MIPTGSRYEDAERHFVTQHFYDTFGHPLLEEQDGKIRFVQSSVECTYLLNTLPLPPPPPAEYFVKDTEHPAMLGFKFLSDSTLWWQVAEVNPHIWYPLDMKPGDYMRVPTT